MVTKDNTNSKGETMGTTATRTETPTGSPEKSNSSYGRWFVPTCINDSRSIHSTTGGRYFWKKTEALAWIAENQQGCKLETGMRGHDRGWSY